MGCAASTGARREAYSPSGGAKPRRNQIVPLEDARAARSVFPLPSEDPRAPQLSASQRVSSCGGSSSREKTASRPAASAVGVVQSALKLKTETRTNQYKLVSGTPIGKGFQSKVCAARPGCSACSLRRKS